MKTCFSCKIEKPLEDFSSDSQKSDGKRPNCKACSNAKRKVSAITDDQAAHRRAQQRDWRLRNPDRVRKHNRDCYEGNREQRLADASRYREENADRIRGYFRELRKRRPDRISKERWRQYSNDWRNRNLNKARAAERERNRANPEQRRASWRKYAQENPEKIRAKNQRRRARCAGVESTLTRDEWSDRLNEFDGCCAYCLAKIDNLSIDHFRPIAKGGGHVLSNVVPACRSCNSSKGDSLVFDWLARGVGQCRVSTSRSNSTDRSSAPTKRLKTAGPSSLGGVAELEKATS